MSLFMMSVTRNYLRVRGEYRAQDSRRPSSMELPPRARRILIGLDAEADNKGTTSACAENTQASC